MSTVILPLDGTPEAECAFMAVQALYKDSPVAIRLLYVGDDEDGRQADYLEKIRGLFEGLGHEPTSQVLPGDPAQVIVQTAQVLEAELIVMERDEREGIAGWVMGSITDKVARDAPCSLLLFNAQPGDSRWIDYRIEQIMVPLDGSSAAESAIEEALPLAERVGAKISVMYSVPWVTPTYVAAPELIAVGSASAETDAALETEMHDYLDGVVERYRERAELGQIAMRGSEADAIRVAAQEHAIDLILMTTQGAGGIVHRGLGSVAEAVTKTSGVPVMLVRPGA